MLSAPALKEHTLNRIGYGQGVWHSNRYDQLGFAGYVAEQLGSTLPAITIDDVFIRPKVERAVLEQRQLESVLLDFWFNHFNVIAGNDNETSRNNPRGRNLLDYQNVAIGSNVLGDFEAMLLATAKSVPMLNYLNNNVNRRPQTFSNGNTVGYNQNYAREVMELHTLGVDGGYDENDVQEVTRILTGWTYSGMNQDPPEEFLFSSNRHDVDAKNVMGVDYPAGGGIEEGEQLLAFLATHPSTAEFLSYKLCTRFVGDGPPASAVEAAKSTFLSTGGDLRAVMATILNRPEFAQAAQAQFRSKVKPPHRYVASALMAMGATAAEDWAGSAAALRNGIINAGDTPYYFAPPTGYPEAPGYWIGTSSIMRRFTLAERIAYIPALRTRMTARAGVTGSDITEAYDAIAAIIVPGGVSPATESAVKDHAAAAAMTNQQRIGAICHMLLCSPEFVRY